MPGFARSVDRAHFVRQRFSLKAERYVKAASQNLSDDVKHRLLSFAQSMEME